LLGAGGIIWFYLVKALVPFDLAFVYPQWEVHATNPLWWIPLIVAVFVSFALWKNRTSKIGRALFFAWSTFCVALLPVMGFIDVGYMKYSLVADHYEHLALISVVAAVAAGASALLSKSSQPGKIIVVAMSAMAVAAFFEATARQAKLYESPRSLFEAALEKNPDSWILHNLLGRELHLAGDVPQAVEEYRRAIKLHADTPEAFADLGSGLLSLGNTSEAIKYLHAALDRAPERPDIETSLATALLTQGDRAAAKELYLQALNKKSDYALAYAGLGNIALSDKNFKEAIDRLRRAVELKPEYIDAHFNLGLALEQTGDIKGAIEQMQEILRLQPDYAPAENAWGSLLFNSNRMAESVEHFEQAIQLNPNDLAAYSNLASSYRRLGRPDLAIRAALAALPRAEANGDSKWAEQIRKWLERQREPGTNSSGPNEER
jgi:tetratricopeptide (TPR) repeat protein